MSITLLVVVLAFWALQLYLLWFAPMGALGRLVSAVAVPAVTVALTIWLLSDSGVLSL